MYANDNNQINPWKRDVILHRHVDYVLNRFYFERIRGYVTRTVPNVVQAKLPTFCCPAERSYHGGKGFRTCRLEALSSRCPLFQSFKNFV